MAQVADRDRRMVTEMIAKYQPDHIHLWVEELAMLVANERERTWLEGVAPIVEKDLGYGSERGKITLLAAIIHTIREGGGVGMGVPTAGEVKGGEKS